MISTLLPNPFCTPAYVTSPSATDTTSAWCVPAKSIPVCFFTSPVVGCTLVPYADVIVYWLFSGSTKFCDETVFSCFVAFLVLVIFFAGGFGSTHFSVVFVFP